MRPFVGPVIRGGAGDHFWLLGGGACVGKPRLPVIGQGNYDNWSSEKAGRGNHVWKDDKNVTVTQPHESDAARKSINCLSIFPAKK